MPFGDVTMPPRAGNGAIANATKAVGRGQPERMGAKRDDLVARVADAGVVRAAAIVGSVWAATSMTTAGLDARGFAGG